MILPVILCGGNGSRLWPLSRSNNPKQFLPLLGDDTMLQATIARLEGLNCSAPMLVCGESHRFIAAEQLRQQGITGGKMILEPVGRNTAPAIALAALQVQSEGADPLLMVLAADHVITQPQAFRDAIATAMPLAEQGELVTFGIVAKGPETGYGYIKCGSKIEQGFRVDSFVEKPNLKTAQEYLSSGDYYWNSGMFLIRASRYLEELKCHNPEILSRCEIAMAGASIDADFIRIEKKAFLVCPDESIDYAVMERTDNAVVVPMDCGWNDVGSWSALWDVSEKDAGGNSCNGDVLLEDTSNCYVRACGDKVVAAVGVDNLIIVDTDDALLVSTLEHAQKIKDIVGCLKTDMTGAGRYVEESGGSLSTHLRQKTDRPWGFFERLSDAINIDERFQVKRLVVNPGAQLSLQMHRYRAEHWIVVSGTAQVTKGGEELLLKENQSTYIPIGVTHRLCNPGVIPLEIIEVQSGSYLGEDDIVRFEDQYNRC